MSNLATDPPLFQEQLQKNKRRGKKVAKILAEFDPDELAVIELEAAADAWREDTPI